MILTIYEQQIVSVYLSQESKVVSAVLLEIKFLGKPVLPDIHEAGRHNPAADEEVGKKGENLLLSILFSVLDHTLLVKNLQEKTKHERHCVFLAQECINEGLENILHVIYLAHCGDRF
jgi:hypothetical protein